MLRAYAAEFAMIVEFVSRLEKLLFSPAGTFADAEFVQQVRTFLPVIPAITKNVPLNSVDDQHRRIKDALSKSPTPQELRELLRELRNRLEDDLRRAQFYYVRPDWVPYYTADEPFGQIVWLSFPMARDDIEAAGKCLALGQGTACVFHLMGVMEIGLRALGLAMKIPYAPSWESWNL